jgi:transposase InsO family protein
MLHTSQKIIKNKVGLLNLADELKNISKACKVMGLSRETFYRYKRAVEEGGVAALLDKTRRKPNLENRVDEEIEKIVVNHAIEFPAYGQARTSNELRKKGTFVSASGVRSIWLRHALESFKKRLLALEKKSAEEGLVLTESQIVALERKKEDDVACGEIETAHPGYLGSQDTFYVGTLKGVGRVYQQTFVDTYSKVAHCKLYTTKTPITAAELLNERVLPFFEMHGMGLLRILTDRGTEYCGKAEQHDFELYLAINDIEHTKTKARHPQTNGICERFHKTILEEFYQVTFRKKIYSTLDELQKDLDDWLRHYNYERTHQGKMCCGRTPMETFLDGIEIWEEKVDSCNTPDNLQQGVDLSAEEMSRLRVSAPKGLGLYISEADPC